MSRLATFAALSAFLFTALPAAAGPSGHWGDRASPRDPALHLIDKKIDKGVRSGALTKHELKRIGKERERLVKTKRRAMLDGVLTRAEYRHVRGEEQKLLDQIDRASQDKRAARLGPQQKPFKPVPRAHKQNKQDKKIKKIKKISKHNKRGAKDERSYRRGPQR